MNQLKQGKLRFWSILAFAVGDINGGGAFNIINLFYAYFLTDAVRLDPAMAAPIFLIGTILDACADPVMGYISDHTKGRLGRRRPYIFAGVPAVILSMLFLWYSPPVESEISRFLIALLAYSVFCLVQTLIMIPYSCLGEELTSDYHERTRINAVRITMYILASLVCAIVPEMIIDSFGDDVQKGYLAMGAVFGGIFAIGLLITALFSREHMECRQNKIDFDFKSIIKDPLAVKSYRYYMVMSLITYLSMDIVLSVFVYAVTYYLKRPLELPVILGALFLSQIAALPFYTWLGRFGKSKVYMAGAFIWILGSLAFFSVGPETPQAMVVLITVIMGIGMSGLELTPHTMSGDVADVGELYYGDRREGIFVGLNTFIRKLALAIASSLLMVALSAAGYLKPVAQVVNGRLTSIAQIQPDSAILAMRIVLSFAPVLFLLVGIAFALRYKITPAVHQRLVAFLEKRRMGLLDEAEEKALKELL